MVRAAIFDLDGTLIDSAPDIHAAVNTVLAAEGLPPVTLAETRGFVGSGAPVLVERVMAHCGLPPEPALHARLLARLLDIYETAVHLTQPYPGVPEALAALAAEGWALGLCTNKPERPARAVLAHLGLAELFSVLVGGDTLPERKPHPLPLRHVVAALGASRAVFVGDSEVDAETARAAGLPFAIYTRGYRHLPLTALPHDLAFDRFAALPAGLARLAA